ncbi:uncharacterized protein N7484_001832 [Penicillium longicatenatum]|uniref:uncharacterized protein n=1 Tax=Penicillium longicatenatum TaxID=1561947 RepID=UPI0025491DA8|nr:uncharacterized protein N7484_001832 [Penicillium longicatenatum]KAJ5658183.1 hypothetical protein N7484_001832 [Penicillium longicatenatum]
MFPSAVLFSTLVVSALAQNSTSYNLPGGFNLGLVKPDELNSWCQGQRNQCPAICKGDTKQNTCDPSTLQFSCICADGKTADVTPYIQTVPFYVCEANYGQCVDAHPNDAMGQEACKKAAKCGNKNATAIMSTSSSMTATSTLTMATATGTDSDSSNKDVTSSAAAASTTTTNAAVPLGGFLETYSTGMMAGLMVLAMRLVL